MVNLQKDRVVIVPSSLPEQVGLLSVASLLRKSEPKLAEEIEGIVSQAVKDQTDGKLPPPKIGDYLIVPCPWCGHKMNYPLSSPRPDCPSCKRLIEVTAVVFCFAKHNNK